MTTSNPTAEIIGGPERFLEAELSQQIQFLTARARAKGSAKGNEALVDLGLKVRQYSTLSLAASGLKPTQRELGAFLDLDPSQIVALVDFLEKRGLVAREVDPGIGARRSSSPPKKVWKFTTKPPNASSSPRVNL